jgi:hypothetical protein
MVDLTFAFLLVATVGLGVRSLLDTYTVRELATRLLGLVALSFAFLVTLDLSALQPPPGDGRVSSSSLELSGASGLSGGGKEGLASWRSTLLPAGFGPAGMSLPPWNPYAVEQQGGLSSPTAGAGAAGAGSVSGSGWGGAMLGVPALNGMAGGAAAGYFPPSSVGAGGSVTIPGMAGSFVPGAAGLAWRPDPTKPPPRPDPPRAPPPDPVAAQALAKLTELLERQMNRLEEKEAEQRRAMSKTYKQNVKLSGDIYRLTSDNRQRVSRLHLSTLT